MIIFLIAGLTLGALWAKHTGYTWLGIDKVAASTIMLVGAFVMFALLLWRMQRDKGTTYDALDMLTDQGRASLDKHIVAIMALLAVWWIVTQTQAGKDVSERVIDILMIFVIYRGAKEAINAYKYRPSEPGTTQEIEHQVIVEGPKAPAVPAAREVRPVKQTAMTKSTRTASGKPLRGNE